VPITGLESQTLEGYEVIVVPGADNQQRIWIMLAPRHPPFYKQVPEGSYWLARDEVGQLARKHKISSTVEQVLRSHLRPEAK